MCYNCPIHTSASTRRWIFDHQLNVTDWPAKSPDLNPIENAWGYLVHHVYKDGKQYYSLNDLREAIIREWDGMAQDFIKKLIDSMPKRVAKVVEVNGKAIGYYYISFIVLCRLVELIIVFVSKFIVLKCTYNFH